MAITYKERDEHRGNPAPHLGQDHFEKSKVVNAAARKDKGPSTEDAAFGDHKQQPADANQRAQRSIETGTGDIRQEKRTEELETEELEEAVDDLDDSAVVKP